MSYEQNCLDYALHGNPERDHWEHEENARYDQFDGRREEFHDTAEEDADRNWWASLSADLKAAHLKQAAELVAQQNAAYANRDNFDQVPF